MQGQIPAVVQSRRLFWKGWSLKKTLENSSNNLEHRTYLAYLGSLQQGTKSFAQAMQSGIVRHGAIGLSSLRLAGEGLFSGLWIKT
jgi:hypothetical protein